MINELIKHRRFFHENAESGLDTPTGTKYILNELDRLGIPAKRCGKSGVFADIGKNENGRRFLLRADFDALDIEEKTGLSFASKNGKMHACGHDMHVAMLLGAARLLKEKEPRGLVRLMFQSGEEILEGAKDMIDSGVLEGGFGGAMMLHIISEADIENGKIIVPKKKVCAPSADFFEIRIKGKSSHGAMVEKGVSSLIAGAEIVRALSIIKAQELGMNDKAALSLGFFESGKNANVIPENALIKGTLRAFDGKTRDFIKTRLSEISENCASAFRASAEVVFTSGCPEFKNSAETAEYVISAAKQTVGQKNVIIDSGEGGSAGSEDFSYVSQKVPSVMAVISAGNGYPLHHPMVDFDEKILETGAKLLTNTAFLYAK